MNDQSKYVNAYIDTTISMLHEQLSTLLQTKAQLKVANELLTIKDGTISNLESQLDQIKNDTSEMASMKANAAKWEADYNAIKNKVSHMDTLIAQMADMKRIILQKDADYTNMVKMKDDEIQSLVQKISDLKADKKSINKAKKQQKTIPEPSEKVVLQTDDF